MSSRALRVEVSGRGIECAAKAEVSFGRTASLVYAPDEDGGHGNFLGASYRRIVANPDWARRLEKAYTARQFLPRAGDRRRGELECASSSDALLMNVFCYPGVLARTEVCAVLGVEPGLRPGFGVRAELPMRNGEVDRTEMDMQLGSTLFEAKLTETGFGRASRERLLRYEGVGELFEIEALPSGATGILGYQLVRGVLAARRREGSYVVLIDKRREDLVEMCFRVLQAARTAEARTALRVVTWQELAGVAPRCVQRFMAERFGIEA